MTNKLISLVIIMLILSIGRSYSEDQFLFPKEKPPIFKKIIKNEDQNFSSNLPQKKPLINEKKETKKEIIKKRVDNYVNFAFKNKNLREIYFVTHPHLKHLEKNSYKINISSIVDEVISESKHSKSIIHINFEKINQSLDKIIYVKGDVFSHLTTDAYSNYYLPEILQRIKF